MTLCLHPETLAEMSLGVGMKYTLLCTYYYSATLCTYTYTGCGGISTIALWPRNHFHMVLSKHKHSLTGWLHQYKLAMECTIRNGTTRGIEDILSVHT